MDALDKDFEILLDDYNRVVALESLGVKRNDPAIQIVARRWVAHEYYSDISADKNTGITAIPGKVLDGGIEAATGLSNILLSRMGSWLSTKEKSIRSKIDEVTSKASGLQRDLTALEPRLRLATELKSKTIETGGWTSKVCVEDKIDVAACIAFADKPTVLDDMAKAYTVFTMLAGRPRTRKGEEMDLRKLGRSTGWAVRRSKGLLGNIELNNAVEAWPLPGNVIVTLRGSGVGGQSIDFAVAREGDYGETIDSLDKDVADKAIKAAWRLTEHLKTRNVKRGVFSYSGIYEKIEELKQANTDDADKTSIAIATKRLKNSLAVEDAITTAMVRVCEGLTRYIKLSL